MSNWFPRRAAAACLVLAAAGWPALAPAQVGHEPQHSPYRDLRATHQLLFSGGYVGGGGGVAGVGPRQGLVAGGRFAISLSAPLEAWLAVHGAQLTRHLIDPAAPPESRAVGTASQQVTIFDAGFALRITGAKTWHGLMPYVGASLGAATGSAVSDASGFSFGTPFQAGPHLGVRFYGRGPLILWLEGWDPIWRLSYPSGWTGGANPVLLPSDPIKEWVHNPTVLIGLGYILRR